MSTPIEPLSTNILALMYFGDVVFAVSGALVAGRKRMDIVGFVLIGTITGGQLYATTALTGAACYAGLIHLPVTELIAESLAFLSCFLLRAAAIIFEICMGPPGEFLRLQRSESQN